MTRSELAFLTMGMFLGAFITATIRTVMGG